VITLNEPEQRLARYLAALRYAHNRRKGAINGRVGTQSDEVTDLEGAGAELAFCKIFNIWPDTEIGERPDHDAILKDGRRVDVKATRHPHGHAIAVRKKLSHPPDVYALMVGTFPTYRYAGMIPASKLLCEEKLTDFGYGATFAARQDELTQ
jgi:hypothetical protein